MTETAHKRKRMDGWRLLASGFALAVVVPFSGLALGMHAGAAAAPKHSKSLLEVKFTDDSDITVQGNTFVGSGADAVNDVLGKAKVKKSGQLFSQDRAKLRKDRADLKAKGKTNVPDLAQWYLVQITDSDSIADVASQLKALPVVVDAYPQPLPIQSPVTPNWEAPQFFEQAAPNGVDLPNAWAWPGGKGGNVKITDIEYSWNVNHEELSKARAPGAVIANGTPSDPFNNTDHGTAVLGMMSADINGLGIYGITPEAKLQLVNSSTTAGYKLYDALNLARTNSSAGDVILIEQQFDGPDTTTTADYVPVEWWGSYYDAIKLATAADITVVEAGGNGNQNLDDATKFGSPFPSGKADSGAILVGAGGACSTVPANLNGRLSFSNYGARVNVHGNGECVFTTGYGTYLNGGPNAMYTGGFNGTSSSSPSIASAAASFASSYKQLNGSAPTAALVRSTLSDVANGTPQNTGSGTLTGNIGPKPDLNKVLPKTDLANPTMPGAFAATIVSGKPKLTWTASTDNVAVTGYKIYRNGMLLTTIAPATTYTDSAATSGSKQYKMSSIDKAGHESTQTAVKTVTVP